MTCDPPSDSDSLLYSWCSLICDTFDLHGICQSGHLNRFEGENTKVEPPETIRCNRGRVFRRILNGYPARCKNKVIENTPHEHIESRLPSPRATFEKSKNYRKRPPNEADAARSKCERPNPTTKTVTVSVTYCYKATNKGNDFEYDVDNFNYQLLTTLLHLDLFLGLLPRKFLKVSLFYI